MSAIIRTIDLESTHPTPAEGGLVEIGFCDLAANGVDLAGLPIHWVVAGGRGRLCHPGCPIPPETSAIHHIIDEDVEGLPNWQPLMSGLLKNAPPDLVAYAAHGADFEKLWMHPDWMGANPVPIIDTYKVALRVYQDAPGHSNQALRYWLKADGLDRATATPAHRAYPDAYVTSFLLRELLNNSGVSIETMVAWSNEPALTLRCYIGDYRKDGKGTPWPEVETSMLSWILAPGKSFKEDVLFSANYHLELRRALDLQERQRASEPVKQAPVPDPVEPPAPDLTSVPSEDVKI